MEIKKGLFSLRNGAETPAAPPVVDHTSRQAELTAKFEAEGFERAGNMSGSVEGLSICLHRIYQSFKAEAIARKNDKDDETRPIRVKIKEHEGNIERLQDKIRLVQDEKKPGILKKIEALRDEVNRIEENPRLVVGEVPGRAAYVIGIAILVFLSVYLFIFYSSASYSAFFKNFDLGAGVASAIFDAQALAKALNDGLAELVLILTMPFVFLGLGYLIHKFQAIKTWASYAKIGALIGVTFVFDGILAYEITEKIYNVECQNTFGVVCEPMSIKMASNMVSFWMIIFAGFVVYIIWGLVFDFIMEEYDKRDAVGAAIRAKTNQIRDFETDISKLDVEIDKMTHAMHARQTELAKLRQIVESSIFISKEFESRITDFLVGWVHWLKANKRPEDDVVIAHSVKNQFLVNVNGLVADSETIAA
jgi:hypothetical protein